MRECGEKLILQSIRFFGPLAQFAFKREQTGALFFGMSPVSNVEHQRKHGDECAGLIVQHGVVPLAIEYRAVFCIVAIVLYAVEFSAHTLAVGNLCDRVGIFRENELPIADVLADHFLSFPAEESFRRSRPARHAKVRVPLDYGERRILNVKGQTLMSFLRRFFDALALRNVLDDGDAAHDLVLLIVER